MSITTLRNRCWVVVLVLIWGGAAIARQDGDTQEGDTSAQTAGGEISGNEVGLSIRRIGVGDKVRPGDWAGYQVEIDEKSTKSREVWVQLELPDADGDQPNMVRVVSTTPNQVRSVWLTGWQPRGAVSGFTYRFSVYEAIPKSGADTTRNVADRYSRGRRLAVRSLQATQRYGIDGSQSLIGVVGLTTDGLEQYPACRDNRTGAPPTGHEITELAAGLKPDDLPDVWQALSPFEAIVWTGSGPDFDPSKIKDTQAQAIREWVRRGGHFIIVLPSVGQSWYGSSAGVNPIADILPIVEPKLMEGLDLNDYRMLFTRSRVVSLGTKRDAALWRLEPAGGEASYDAMPILRGPPIAGAPNGAAVVTRRLVGTGAVTVVGIDLSRRDLAAKDALQADVFWNRVLGKRLELITQAELAALQLGKKKGGSPQGQYNAQRPPIEFDGVIPEQINKTVSAVKGLLMAFVVFTLYWLLAGPLGYFVLKQRNMRQHGWVVFLGVAAVFTVIGWGGAKVLRTGRDADKHLTFVDHVYGQSNQRIRSWMELTLPKYGEQRVSVAGEPVDAAGTASEWHNTVAVWQPQDNQKLLGSFPDARGYTVDARYPETVDFPARATTRQLQVDFAGSVPLNWGMPRPMAAEGTALGKEIWIEKLAQPNWEGSTRLWKVHGVLTHSLPAELRDVLVVVVHEPLGRISKGEIPSKVYAQQLTKPWKPGEALDLEDALGKSKLGELNMGQALRKWRGEPPQNQFGGGAMLAQGRDFASLMYGLAFYPMLAPPEPSNNAEFRVVRESAQNCDLGRWFTQPCVMVIGILGNKTEGAVECPVPVSIDGATGESVRKQIKGTTVVRWVYPLQASPPAWEVIPFDPKAEDDGDEEKPKQDLPEADGRG